MPEISIIIPVYNIEKYVLRCIESVKNQSFTDYEVIMIDDGSTDNSGTLCENICKKENNYTVIHKENAGLGFARNSGLEVAKGKYIMFLDGDDYILPNHLEKLYNRMIECGADSCLSGHTRIYKDKTEQFPNVLLDTQYEDSSIINEVLPKMCGKKYNGTDYVEMSVWLALYKREVIEKNKLRFHSEREFISEDLIFNLDFYPHAKRVCVSDSVGYCYCDNEGSLTTRYRVNRFEMQKKMTNEVIRRTKELGIYSTCKERINTSFLGIVRYSIKLEQKFSNVNGKKKAYKNVKKICEDNFLQEILDEYPDKKMPFKSRMVHYLIKNKKYKMLWVVMAYKNILKR